MKKHHHFLSFLSHPSLQDIEFFNPDFDGLHSQSQENKNQDSVVETLLAFGNLGQKSGASKMKDILEKNEHLNEIGEFSNAVYKSMVSQFGQTVADIIMLDIKNDSKCTTISEIRELLTETADSAFPLASDMCQIISDDLGEGNNGERIAAIIDSVGSVIPSRIMYSPVPAISKSTGEILYCDRFSVDSTNAALYLCFVLAAKEKYHIARCKVCGNYFMPSSKSNEVYCKDCRNTTYDTKVKQDEVLSAYRTIYKTQNARKQRNLHRPNITEKFEKWKEFAKIKLQQCRDQKITLEEMKTAISSDEWISDVFPE